LKLLLEEKMDGSMVKMDLKYIEEKGSPQVASPIILLQITNIK
jgi:hypothetical protein